MRLIDIDKVVSDYKGKNKSLQNVTWIELTDYEVKAIPIEWILKWACEFIDPNSEGYKMAMELVHDWRKENEHKESD